MRRAELLATAWRYTFGGQHGQLSAFMSRLSLLGLVLAITLLLCVLSVMNGFDREMRERILSLVPHITVHAAIANDAQTWAAVQQQLEQHPQVERAVRFAAFEGLLVIGRRAEPVAGIGLPPQAFAVFEPMLRSGSLEDMSGWERGLLLGSVLAERAEVGPGDALSLVLPARGDGGAVARSEIFRVAGILHTGTELDESLAVTTLAAALAAGSAPGQQGLRLHTRDLFGVATLREALLPLLPPGFYLSDWTMSHGNLYAAIQLSRRLISILLLSIIGVAAFNLVSSLILVVIDKRGDIAILRALGAEPRTVARLFLLQGALVGAFGSALGCLFGAVLSWVVPRLVAVLDLQLLSTEVYPVSFIPVDMRWQDFLLVGAASLLLCLLAAVYPAQRAAGLAPARVLQGDG